MSLFSAIKEIYIPGLIAVGATSATLLSLFFFKRRASRRLLKTK